MFTVEIKINGSLINHIYGHNEGPSDEIGKDHYRYELYEVETRSIRNGEVNHHYSDGINALVATILQDAGTKRKKGK